MPFSMKLEITTATLVSVKSYGWKACVMVTTEDLVRISGQYYDILKGDDDSLGPEKVPANHPNHQGSVLQLQSDPRHVHLA